MAKKKVGEKVIGVTIKWEGDDEDAYYGDGEGISAMFQYGESVAKGKAPPAPKYGTPQYWKWYWEHGEGAARNAKQAAECWSAQVSTEPTCCAFKVLGDFYCRNKEGAGKYTKMIGEALGERLKQRKEYISAYTPDNAEYKETRAILEAAGFQKGMTIKSTHGKYTNTRWEWIPTGEKLEEIISSINV
jgi:hypothetical protein